MEDQKIVIELKDVSKIFEIPHEKREYFKSFFLNPFRRIPKEEFKALNDVSLTIKQGEFVGIIGKNGSGKSTLLKILAGIYTPTDGKVKVKGHLVPFLELGVGFNPDLSGRENIFLNGTILGMTRSFLETKYEEIVEFAEIRDFIDLQVKNYSSGMIVRLAFAIAVQSKADIYLLDEILAVGDSQFQKKSLKKMLELLNSGATVILVSHSMNDVEKYCDRVVFLEKGTVKFNGNVTEGIERYQLSWMNPEEQKRYFEEKAKQQKILSLDNIELGIIKQQVSDENSLEKGQFDRRAEITELVILGEDGKKTKRLAVGEKFQIIFKAKIFDKIENPVVYVGFHKIAEQPLLGLNTSRQKNGLIRELNKDATLEVTFTAKNVLLPGNYTVWGFLGDPNIYGKGTGQSASQFTNFYQIEVYELNAQSIPDWSGLIAHDFTYKVTTS